MTDFPKCDLKTGVWAPPAASGSLPVMGVPQTEKPRDQLAGDVFGEQELKDIRAAVKKKYADVAKSAEGLFKYPTGRKGAVQHGYDQAIIEAIPAELLNSFCGVGNPLEIREVPAGSNVLDIGCGGGFDLIVARRKTGSEGRICGVDMTPEMVKKAKVNLAELGIDDIEVTLIDSEKLPFADDSFDVVISNGVINLSPAKLELFREVRRVLKPGGRLQFADIVLDKELPPSMTGNLDAWAQWIGGAVSVGDQIALLEKAGFTGVECVGKTGISTSAYTVGALFVAEKG